ncbi:ferredoxin--NADP reductase [Alphaproteobacteria bacterium]|nr:ferredoxin--NADP reductase [Alphaproteobacteria bacterium]
MSKFLLKVLSITHWTDNLFSFQVERPKDFKFKSGEFVMIGLPNSKKPILRAYSICSPSWDEKLEFYSIIVENGPLTSKLKNIKINDEIILMSKSTGTLIIDALKPAKRLFLFSTGTGFAPFSSIIRDPETYDKFEKIIITHTCRFKNELHYSEKIIYECRTNEILKSFIENRLIYYKTTTQEISEYNGRITNNIQDKSFFIDLNLDSLNSSTDCAMLCGSLDFNNELKNLLIEKNFEEGATNKPNTFVLEKAFVG